MTYKHSVQVLGNRSNPGNLAFVGSQHLLCMPSSITVCLGLSDWTNRKANIMSVKFLEKRPATCMHLPFPSSSIQWDPQRKCLIIPTYHSSDQLFYSFIINQTEFRNLNTIVRIHYLKKTSYSFLFVYPYLFSFIFHRISWPTADNRSILFCKGNTTCSPFVKLTTI